MSLKLHDKSKGLKKLSKHARRNVHSVLQYMVGMGADLNGYDFALASEAFSDTHERISAKRLKQIKIRYSHWNIWGFLL